MEARAITKFIRLSPRKVRLVVDQIRGKNVEEALNILKFTPKRSAGIVAKTVRPARAHAGKPPEWRRRSSVRQAGAGRRGGYVETLYLSCPGTRDPSSQTAQSYYDRP